MQGLVWGEPEQESFKQLNTFWLGINFRCWLADFVFTVVCKGFTANE